MYEVRGLIGVSLLGICVGCSGGTDEERHPGETPAWGYEAQNGPADWASLSGEYALCAHGSRQSPIDLVDPAPATRQAIAFNYQSGVPDVSNNGHTVEVAFGQKNWIEVDGATYELLQFHFHTPSEHTVAGRSFDMEVHLVHRNEDGALAVVALLVQRGREHPVLGALAENLPMSGGMPSPQHTAIDPADLLPSEQQAFHYEGSLTTPPCSEGVQWFVLTTAIELSDAQFDAFKGVMHHNSRPVQPLGGREVFVGEGSLGLGSETGLGAP